ncbi:hypothetical protein MMC17_006774 [Xylographa soralifera]|nr:hypothetical protein [Xylographa soralifera]
MSGCTTPDCGSSSEFHDNDRQSERNVRSQEILIASDDAEIDNDSSTVLARCGSESGRLVPPELAGDLELLLNSHQAEPRVDLFQGIGTWAPQNSGTDIPRHRDVIAQELYLEDEPIDTHVHRRVREEERPWSPLDRVIVADDRISITWIIRIYPSELIKHTKMAMQQFLISDEVGCSGDIERTRTGMPDAHRHVRLAFETLLAMVGALAIFAFLTLQTYGVEVSFMLIYGLILLAFGVLIVIRLLWA